MCCPEWTQLELSGGPTHNTESHGAQDGETESKTRRVQIALESTLLIPVPHKQ
jgi:hypothetical protein